jgi:hypothetical protein
VGTTWYERGFAKGIELGRRKALRISLEARFGALSPAVEAKLAAWPADKLEDLGRALLTAQSLRELGLEK